MLTQPATKEGANLFKQLYNYPPLTSIVAVGLTYGTNKLCLRIWEILSYNSTPTLFCPSHISSF